MLQVSDYTPEEVQDTAIEQSNVIRILLVDDDEVDAAVTREYLKKDPQQYYNVVWANSREEALQRVGQDCYDVVLVDYYLGADIGLDVVHALSSADFRGPIILLTQHEHLHKDNEAINAGVTDYLVKSHVNPSLLSRSIRFSLERRKVEEALAVMAETDALTGIANRHRLMIDLQTAIADAERGNRKFALLLIDLDHFKSINDSWGHGIGDALLREATMRLVSCCRENDIVARLGGDEFALLARQVRNIVEIDALAQRLVDCVGLPYEIEGHLLQIGASIGIVSGDSGPNSVDQMLLNADSALYRAKHGGRGGYCFYDQRLDEQVRRRRRIESELKHAIEQRELTLNFQPIFDCRHHTVTGGEALIRWRRGDTITCPDEFIPIAERTGHIVAIGNWVINNAVQQLVRWRMRFDTDMRICINISPIQLKQNDFVTRVLSALQHHELDPSLIELEITETAILEGVEAAAANARELQKLGVSFALDDFGTGFSSMTMLKQFPLNRLKLDKTLTLDLETDPHTMAIMRTAIDLGHALGLTVIAEGVENSQQLQLLRKMGCDQVQGLYLGEPVPSNEFEALFTGNSLTGH